MVPRPPWPNAAKEQGMTAKTTAKTKAEKDVLLVRLRVDLVRNGWQDFQEGDVSRTVLVR